MDNIDILVMSLAKAQYVEAVILGEKGVLTHGHAGLIVIDRTASSTPETSHKIAALS